MRRNSSLAEELFASEETFCCTEVVSDLVQVSERCVRVMAFPGVRVKRRDRILSAFSLLPSD